MSDALDYLLKARPEAMGHYFQFLAQAGKHLDPKTRALISVITKVHAQTDAGFRQYLKRALKAGASPNEVLDALLMAFPALGLTKLIWAIDLLLTMNLPEFRLDALNAPARWLRLGAIGEFESGKTVRVDLPSKTVFVHREANEFRIFDARCPHQGTIIPADSIDGDRIVCPRHGWAFDQSSGACVEGDGEGLSELPCKVDDGILYAMG